MSKSIAHLWGPISIQWYGLTIVIGLMLFMYLFLRDPKRKSIISTDDFFAVITLGIFAGVLGGRLLFWLANWSSIDSFFDLFAIWKGGFSILGTTIAILIVIPLYLAKKKIPILPFLDLVSIYIPLLQSVSRIGCFIAGCCYGIATSFSWGWCYTHTSSAAPLGVPLHPTQLYSAGLLFVLFLCMLAAKNFFKKPGQLTALYLILFSLQRFVVDYWRADREFFLTIEQFSIHQFLCVILFSMGLFGLVYTFFKKAK